MLKEMILHRAPVPPVALHAKVVTWDHISICSSYKFILDESIDMMKNLKIKQFFKMLSSVQMVHGSW